MLKESWNSSEQSIEERVQRIQYHLGKLPVIGGMTNLGRLVILRGREGYTIMVDVSATHVIQYELDNTGEVQTVEIHTPKLQSMHPLQKPPIPDIDDLLQHFRAEPYPA